MERRGYVIRQAEGIARRVAGGPMIPKNPGDPIKAKLHFNYKGPTAYLLVNWHLCNGQISAGHNKDTATYIGEQALLLPESIDFVRVDWEINGLFPQFVHNLEADGLFAFKYVDCLLDVYYSNLGTWTELKDSGNGEFDRWFDDTYTSTIYYAPEYKDLEIPEFT